MLPAPRARAFWEICRTRLLAYCKTLAKECFRRLFVARRVGVRGESPNRHLDPGFRPRSAGTLSAPDLISPFSAVREPEDCQTRWL